MTSESEFCRPPRYSIPEDFPYEQARVLFKTPVVTPAAEMDELKVQS